MKGLCRGAIFIYLFLISISANAALVGLTSTTNGTNSSLYTIDTNTGQATFLTGTSGISLSPGLEYLNGVLYATNTICSGCGDLVAIDLVSGTVSPVPYDFGSGGSLNLDALAANQNDGLIYAIDFYYNDIRTLNPLTGDLTVRGLGGFVAGGAAYDSNNGILYATNFDKLYTIDPMTGAQSLIGYMGVSTGPFAGLAFDPKTGTLYMAESVNNALYTLNTSTGVATLIGPTGLPALANEVGITGLTWIPDVPLPASIWLFSSGLLSLSGIIRAKRRS
jgi:DNA-binding beta-propeller fold protein YncE